MEGPELTIFILLLFAGVYMTVYGLPGALAIVIVLVVFAALTGFEIIGVKHLVVIGILSVLAEILDAFVYASNIRRPPVTRVGAAASLCGAFAGAVLLTPFFYGFGTLLGVFVGGFAALMTVQKIEQKKLKPAFREPVRAALRRGAATCLKGMVAMGTTAFVLSRLYS